MSLSLNKTLWTVCLISTSAVVVALVSQYQFGLKPCPWCVLQRFIYTVMAVLSGLGALISSPSIKKTLTGLTGLSAACGLAAALYQNLVAAHQDSCFLGFADRVVDGLHLERIWPFLFKIKGSCADAAVSVLGVPYELWSALLYTALILVIVRILTQRRA